MKTKLFLCIFIFTLFMFSKAEEISDLIQKGDGLFIKRDNPSNLSNSYKIYKSALLKESKNAEILWRLTRWCAWVANNSLKKNLINEGIEYAKKAISINPLCYQAHYWLGILYGLKADQNNPLISLFLVNSIKKEMNEVIKLKPDYDSGGAYIVLGRTYFKMPKIIGGSSEKAKEYLEKATKYKPVNPISLLFLADLYISKGEKEKPKYFLPRLLKNFFRILCS